MDLLDSYSNLYGKFKASKRSWLKNQGDSTTEMAPQVVRESQGKASYTWHDCERDTALEPGIRLNLNKYQSEGLKQVRGPGQDPLRWLLLPIFSFEPTEKGETPA